MPLESLPLSEGSKQPERMHMSVWTRKQQCLQERRFCLTKKSLCLLIWRAFLPEEEGPLYRDDLRPPREALPSHYAERRGTGIWSGTGGQERQTPFTTTPVQTKRQGGEKQWLSSPKSDASYFY